MSGQGQPIIVVKKIKKVAGGHHGGAWKIAYADFVTAMMAFFLLMWLITQTPEEDRKGIAEYFTTPLEVAVAGMLGTGDNSPSVIQGGGQDLSHSAGQQRNGENPENPSIDLEKVRKELARLELGRLESLKEKFEVEIDADPRLSEFRNQIRLQITPDGLEITIVDEQHRAMFNSGSAVLQDHSKEMLHKIGALLNGVPNAISFAGHTDTSKYSLGDRGYSNWELSADRANACRRELVKGGLEEKKVLRVVGLASSMPLDADDPASDINRRISVVVLNDKTERQIRGISDTDLKRIRTTAEAAKALGVEPADAPAEHAADPGSDGAAEHGSAEDGATQHGVEDGAKPKAGA